jgi:hypothetical protein
MLGVLLAPVSLRGQEVVGRIARAWVTVLMGIGFFAAAIWMNRGEVELRFSVRWLLAGLVVTVLWSALQAATFYLNVLPKELVTQWQRVFSLRELIRTNRISGMAYEPSWLAGQLSTVYLPWLLAALLTGIRVTRLRWLEPGLLFLAAALVVGTFSRGGILIAALALGATLALVGRHEIRTVWKWFTAGFSRFQAAVWRLGVALVAVALVAGALLFLGQKGYVARIWTTRASNVADFLIQNSAGARAAYTTSALKTFEDYRSPVN